MSISVFDLFKIGIGPSSSHMMGPWNACRRFVQSLEQAGQLRKLERVQIILFGSLAKTGWGHGTAKAIQLGLMDADPEHIEPRAIPNLLSRVKKIGRLQVGGVMERPSTWRRTSHTGATRPFPIMPMLSPFAAGYKEDIR